MQAFMPGTQPRGTHAFDPASSSSQSAMNILTAVNAEEDGAEDCIDPSLDLPMANVPAADSSPLLPTSIPDTSLLGMAPSIASSSFSPLNLGTSSASSGSKPPPSSSLPPTVYPIPIPPHDVSMGSAHSITTGSDAGSSQLRKRKYDARSTSGVQPPRSKRASNSKTSDLNPVIISNALNSTLNRIADVMERTLDVTAVATAPATSVPPPSIVASSIESQTALLSSTISQSLDPLSNPSSTSASTTEILDQAIRIVSADDSPLSEDELFSASLFFTSASEDAIRAARTFIALSNNQVVQYRFLRRQLETAALLPGKGKSKAMDMEDGDGSMIY